MAAELVPETRDLGSEDAWAALRRVHYLPLLEESWRRLANADGYTYARAVGLQMALAMLPALIFFVAVAVWTGNETLLGSMEGIVSSLTPGPTSGFMQQAVDQGEQGARGNIWAMLLGGFAALTSGAIGMNQIQKAANRIYGIENDRNGFKGYGLGIVLSLSVGILPAGAFVAIAFGASIADALEGESVWAWLRWPLGALAAVVAMSALYKFAPRRNQPRVSWLLVGGLTATFLWLVFSGGLAGFLGLSATFGQTYGPLAGIIGLLVWTQLTALATLAGIAFAAQLEDERGKAFDPELREKMGGQMIMQSGGAAATTEDDRRLRSPKPT